MGEESRLRLLPAGTRAATIDSAHHSAAANVERETEREGRGEGAGKGYMAERVIERRECGKEMD